MKYGNSAFMQVPLYVFEECYKKCKDPVGALYLYVCLKRLENIYTNPEERDFFFRTDVELAEDCRIGLSTLRRYKKDLLQTDCVESWQAHFIYGGKKSEKHITCYRLK